MTPSLICLLYIMNKLHYLPRPPKILVIIHVVDDQVNHYHLNVVDEVADQYHHYHEVDDVVDDHHLVVHDYHHVFRMMIVL